MVIGHICLIILLSFTKLSLGDEYDAIRAEEESRHKDVLAKYLKAIVGGALHNLFPKVTPQEQAEAERWFADCNQLLDPPLPHTEEQLEEKICKPHRERGQKILGYIRKRFPTHLITQVTVRFSIESIGKQNDAFCKDKESRSNYVKNAAVINQHLNDINVARNKLIDNSLVIVYANDTKKLPTLCCTYWAYKAHVLNSITEPEAKQFFADGLAKYHGNAVKYICLHHSEGSQACTNLVIPAPPTNVPRFTSGALALIESVSHITQIAI
jgi:hypothetical protein